MRRLVPVLLVASLATACGSGGGRLSHDELIAKADAVCARAHTAVANARKPKTDPQVVPYLNRLIQIGQDEHDELSALKPSEQDATPYGELLTRFERALAVTVRVRDAAVRHQVVRYNVLVAQVVRLNSDTRSFAAGFGLKTCSKLR